MGSTPIRSTMDFKINAKPKIKLRLKTSMTFNGKHYDIGHEFHVVGDDPMRGYDLEDSEGNRMYEVRMIMDHFERI